MLTPSCFRTAISRLTWPTHTHTRTPREGALLTAHSVVAPGEIRGGHQEVDEEDVGRDPAAEVVLGRRAQPDVPQRK